MKRFLSLAIIAMIAALAFAQTASAPRELLKQKGKTAISGLKSAQRVTPEKGILKVAKKVDGEYTPIEAQDYSAEYFAEDGDWYCDLHYGYVDFLFDIVTNDPTPLNGTYTLAQMDPTYSVVAYMGQYLYSTYTDATFTVDATGNVEAVVSLANGENYRVTYTKPEIPEITDYVTIDFPAEDTELVDMTAEQGAFQIVASSNKGEELYLAFFADQVPGHYTIDDVYMKATAFYVSEDDYEGVAPFAVDATVTETGASVIYDGYNGTEYTFNITFPKEEEPSTEISELVVGQETITLDAATEYTLNAAAILDPSKVVTINGNGATIKVGEAGKFSVQKGIVLDNVVLDGTATENAIVELSSAPDASLATYTDAVGTEGEEGYVPASMKYANASWKGYEAQEITIKNSTLITNNSVIRPAAAWALRALNIDNTIVEVKYKTGKAIINMEENGAGVIQDINIKNSTIYADDAATEMRFHRYAAQNDPWRVWGYEGEDKNVTKDTWTLENNTFVGVCGNKEFSNNMKNTNATEFTFKNNAFVNTWRINKLGGNCKRNFAKEDNVISGGTNPVDGTDANWFTAVDDLGAVWNFETAPAATDVEALGAAFGLYEDYKAFGDPRWAANAKPEPTEISEMVVGKKALTLKADKEYTLNANAVLGLDVVTINGNGATIKVGEAGKFSVQKGIVLDNVVLDGTATENAIVELSSAPDASLATYTDAVGTEGEEGYVPASMKYANASWKGYEAQEITIKNSTLITNNSVIRPAAAWALRALNIDNTIVEVKYKSGKAIINMEENGAGVIQDINIKNSTIYADDAATEMRFHRYAAQNDPWRVWGYEGEDKNVTKDTWTLENNTFVGVCGNKEFSNNMKNTNATEFTFKNNAFVNTWRINKLGGNCKRNFAKEDNVISGGTNPVDGTDANWFTAVDDLGAVWNFETAPAATDVEALGAAFGLYEDYKAFGDPRWAANAKPEPTEISEMVVGKKALTLKADKEYTLNANAVLGLDVVTINGNGATIKVGEAGKFSVQKGIILDNVVLDGTATANAIVELSATPDASLATFTDAVGTEGEEGYVPASMKYANASWKGYEAQEITIKNSTVITNNSVIRPAAAWALRALNIDNTIVEVKYKSGKAIINMEENGAGVIQDINIKNSTIYADDAATEMRFHRYAAQNDPWRVWGYEGEDKNATKDTWTLENNTFVGVCGNKEFSNNMKNTNATEFTFKNNAFVNTWRINKLGGNCKRNFEQTDNVISGGTNPVDGTDANWFTAVDDLGAVWNFETAPAATDVEALGAAFGLYEDYKAFGDPRWADYSKGEAPTGITNVASQSAKNGAIYNLAGQRVNANAKGILIINGKKVMK